jgi:lysophospholipase L1-like esterase
MRLARASYVLNLVLGGALVSALAVWAHRRSQPPAADFWTARHIEARRDLYERLTIPPGATVLVGDSLTERAEWRELLGRDDVYNRGISGDTVAGVRERIDAVLRARPRAIVLMIGINDLEAGRAPAEVAAAFEELLAAMRAAGPETRLVVLSVLPMRDVGRGVGVANAQVGALNDAIAASCERHRAAFLDLRPTLTDETGALGEAFTRDGVHLTGEGYARWAEALKPAVR